MTNKSISQRLKEIDEKISALYQEKHMLEMEQQEYWRKMGSDSLIANAEDVPIAWMSDSEDNLDRLYEYGNTN